MRRRHGWDRRLGNEKILFAVDDEGGFYRRPDEDRWWPVDEEVVAPCYRVEILRLAEQDAQKTERIAALEAEKGRLTERARELEEENGRFREAHRVAVLRAEERSKEMAAYCKTHRL